MAITRNNPNKVHLGGDMTLVNDLACSEALTPGHLVERFNSAGTIRFRKHSVAAGGGPAAFALDMPMLNKGVDDASAAGDLVEVGIMHPGAAVWAFIASGQNIAAGNKLESAGDGTLRIFAAGVVFATALENKPSVVVQTRIRVEIAAS